MDECAVFRFFEVVGDWFCFNVELSTGFDAYCFWN